MANPYLGLGNPFEKPLYSETIYRDYRYMLDGVSLDQMRAFIAAAEEGSFSAAARKLRRAQSVVSELVSGLEGQIGVTLLTAPAAIPH